MLKGIVGNTSLHELTEIHDVQRKARTNHNTRFYDLPSIALKHHELQSTSSTLTLPIVPLDIVAYARLCVL